MFEITIGVMESPTTMVCGVLVTEIVGSGLTVIVATVTLSPPQSFVIFTLYTLSPTVAVLGV